MLVELVLENARMPVKSTFSQGLTLFAASETKISPRFQAIISTGIKIVLPDNFVAFVTPMAALQQNRGNVIGKNLKW